MYLTFVYSYLVGVFSYCCFGLLPNVSNRHTFCIIPIESATFSCLFLLAVGIQIFILNQPQKS